MKLKEKKESALEVRPTGLPASTTSRRDVHLQRTHLASQVMDMIDQSVVLAGWVHDVRVLGGIAFLLLRDHSGIVQVAAPKTKTPAHVLEQIGKLHQEDVVVVRGRVLKSKIARKGVEVVPDEIEVLSRSETPLPLDPRGVQNTLLDTRLTWRFLDFRSEQSRAIFRIQSRIINGFRSFFLEHDYLEIQPPVIIASASEGGAELFSMKYFEKDAYLAQSPQLYKQMCAIAFEKVFSVVPVFRAEKFEQPTHLNEIRQVDIEQAFATDLEVMKILEEFLAYCTENVRKECKEEMDTLDAKLDPLQIPLKRVAYKSAIELLSKNGDESAVYGTDFSKTQEKKLSELVGERVFFITQWPSELKAFYAMPNDDGTCRAFDVIFDGLEIASGTQRVHMPELLVKQLRMKGLNPETFKSYVDAFRYGAPYHAGWSIGLERLTMKITQRENIREATMFPRDRTRLTP